MFKLIKNARFSSDTWKTVTLTGRETPLNVRLPVGPLLVPLSVWQARRAELIHREYEHGWALGIWLANAQEAHAIEQDIDDFIVIAVEFDKPASSYSTARLLRERFGYRGELRASGTIPDDQAAYLYQAGYDAVAGNNTDVISSNWFNFNQPSGLRQAAG